ncbi:uroporphyrinogen-III synthase [Acaryochloris marina]|uniref:uroporphyrinogen-III synthase n=1 Tax=Acaryochloris marina TaxID=155978 RepID=UPI001BAEFA97|nr:uroporphyrinogen-III synthase [Acaryochloris marina]QUY45284.1 uroporphyrinogen-III synthase [Acaryochloris marina S15]
MTDLLLSTAQLPLDNKRIVMTAPRPYAARLATAMILQGGLPIVMPTIETCALDPSPSLDQALQHLKDFSWVAFTSRTGIQAVILRLQQLDIPLFLLNQCHICAIGQDAERLQELGVRVDLVPDESSPSGIVKELAQIPGIETQRILVPIPQVERIPEPDIVPEFLADLQQLGLTVVSAPAYVTRRLNATDYAVELEQIYQGRVDAIAFSSTAEISALLQMVDSKTLMKHCVIACFGPYTAGNAKALGLSVDIVSKDFSSFTGFVEAIAQFFHPASADIPRQDPVILP